MAKYNLVADSSEVKTPRHWEQKGPQEKWDKEFRVQVPGQMYDGLLELSHSTLFETGGKIQPLLREAVEEFLMKYLEPGTIRSALEQMASFRDAWAQDIMAQELLENLSVIGQVLDRWRMAKETGEVLNSLRKMIASVMLLGGQWRRYALEQLRNSESVQMGMKFAYDTVDLDERKELDNIHDILNAE